MHISMCLHSEKEKNHTAIFTFITPMYQPKSVMIAVLVITIALTPE